MRRNKKVRPPTWMGLLHIARPLDLRGVFARLTDLSDSAELKFRDSSSFLEAVSDLKRELASPEAERSAREAAP